MRIFESAKKQIDFAIEKPQTEVTDDNETHSGAEKMSENKLFVVQKPIISDDSPLLDGVAIHTNNVDGVVDVSKNQGMALAAIEVSKFISFPSKCL